MINSYEPIVKTTIGFIKLLNVNVDDDTINETLHNHPDWPALISVSDSLNKWQIPNAAGKIENNEIDEQPLPFLAYVNNAEFPLLIVKAITDKEIKYSQKNKIDITEPKENFYKRWNGVFLIAEPTKDSGDPYYKANQRKKFYNNLLPVVTVAAIVMLSFFSLYKTVTQVSRFEIITVSAVYVQYLILLVGVFVTSLLVWYEIDKNNPLLQKVCTGFAKGNCNAILTGNKSKVFSWLSWSEVGFFYFIGNMLILLSSQYSFTNSIKAIAWINILALPYTIFSIYYQWKVAKKWCILCLSVQALLILGALNSIVSISLFSFAPFAIIFFIQSFFLYLLPFAIWFTLKPFILRLQDTKNTKREFLRLKFNIEVFDTLLKKQKQLVVPTDGLGINLGNPAATNTIIKVCSPYCGPCAKAHAKIEALLENNSNVKMKIIFTTSNDENHYAIKPTRHLMAIAEKTKDEKILKQSLDDWYLPDKKDYELFAAKHPMNGELLQQANKIAIMEKWCNEEKIIVTPTIFFNGYQLPNAYNIEDLQYFLLE